MANNNSEIIINPSMDVGAGFRLRTKDEGPKEGRFMVKEHPDLCRLLIDLATNNWTSERLMSIPKHLLDRLLELGVLIESRDVPPEIYFRCDLNDLPLDLIPTKARAELMACNEPESLVVNKNVYCQVTHDLPDEIAHRVQVGDSFVPRKFILWVDDPLTGVLAPYGCNLEDIEIIRALINGTLSPTGLDAQTLESLCWIGVLMPRHQLEARARNWHEVYAEASDQFRANKYAVLRKVLPPMQTAALRKHFRSLYENKQIFLDTEQVVGGRYVMTNEGLARFVHHQFAPLVSHITQQQTIATFSNLLIYIPGAVLERHIDRPQCPFNLSLLVDTDPEADMSDSWPIYLEVDGEAKEVRLEMGDGVLYGGTTVPHWRNALPEGNLVTVIAGHFAHADFKGSLT